MAAAYPCLHCWPDDDSTPACDEIYTIQRVHLQQTERAYFGRAKNCSLH